MTRALLIHRAGPAITVQDLGRPGYLARGLSRGGAADRLALRQGAALLGQAVGAALEMAGLGGSFSVTAPTRIALTGAPMRASRDGTPLSLVADFAYEPRTRTATLEVAPFALADGTVAARLRSVDGMQAIDDVTKGIANLLETQEIAGASR